MSEKQFNMESNEKNIEPSEIIKPMNDIDEEFESGEAVGNEEYLEFLKIIHGRNEPIEKQPMREMTEEELKFFDKDSIEEKKVPTKTNETEPKYNESSGKPESISKRSRIVDDDNDDAESIHNILDRILRRKSTEYFTHDIFDGTSLKPESDPKRQKQINDHSEMLMKKSKSYEKYMEDLKKEDNDSYLKSIKHSPSPLSPPPPPPQPPLPPSNQIDMEEITKEYYDKLMMCVKHGDVVEINNTLLEMSENKIILLKKHEHYLLEEAIKVNSDKILVTLMNHKFCIIDEYIPNLMSIAVKNSNEMALIRLNQYYPLYFLLYGSDALDECLREPVDNKLAQCLISNGVPFSAKSKRINTINKLVISGNITIYESLTARHEHIQKYFGTYGIALSILNNDMLFYGTLFEHKDIECVSSTPYKLFKYSIDGIEKKEEYTSDEILSDEYNEYTEIDAPLISAIRKDRHSIIKNLLLRRKLVNVVNPYISSFQSVKEAIKNSRLGAFKILISIMSNFYFLTFIEIFFMRDIMDEVYISSSHGYRYIEFMFSMVDERDKKIGCIFNDKYIEIEATKYLLCRYVQDKTMTKFLCALLKNIKFSQEVLNIAFIQAIQIDNIEHAIILLNSGASHKLLDKKNIIFRSRQDVSAKSDRDVELTYFDVYICNKKYKTITIARLDDYVIKRAHENNERQTNTSNNRTVVGTPVTSHQNRRVSLSTTNRW
jgi:hypothetical protein